MMSEQRDLGFANDARFNELMRGNYKKVYNAAYRLAGNRLDAEDLTQEAFYRAYRSFDDFEGDRPFENWILRIVSRLFLDMLRAKRRRIQSISFDAPLGTDSGETIYFDKADDRPNPEKALLEGHLSEDLSAALQALTPDQRELLLMADVEGLAYQDIADRLGKPVGTIRSRLHRIHRQLRMKLQMSQIAPAV